MSNGFPMDYRAIAELTGLTPATLRSYRASGRLPEPDLLAAPDRPRWYSETIVAWMTRRVIK